jgi:hypothetical protein
VAPIQFQFIPKIGLEGQLPGTQVMWLMLSFGHLEKKLIFFPDSESLGAHVPSYCINMR